MIRPTPATASSLNINEASKSCGLSPSVLRIWELRYGWPSPKRKTNGYRSYSTHQVQELTRIASLVKSGTPISSLIIDGLPRWPADVQRTTSPRVLAKTRFLAKPIPLTEAALQRDLIDALETRRGAHATEILQRIFWSVRPADEPRSALVPALVAMAELRRAGRPLEGEAELHVMVEDRCTQLLRMVKNDGQPLRIVPARPADTALASLVALILNYRQIAAQPSQTADDMAGACVMVSEDEFPAGAAVAGLGRLTTLGDAESPGLGDLLDGLVDLPWAPKPLFATAP